MKFIKLTEVSDIFPREILLNPDIIQIFVENEGNEHVERCVDILCLNGKEYAVIETIDEILELINPTMDGWA